jgi:hypothetical protein
LNKTEKFIVAFLLANIALAGALHFLMPAVHPATRLATPVVEVVTANPENEIVPTVEANAPQVAPSDPTAELRDWIARDPHAAIEWAVQQPLGEKRAEVLEAACFEIANVNPAEAVALAEKYALTNHATLASLTPRWAQQDLRAAHAWVLAKPAGGERNELAARVGFVWSATEPTAAADFVIREIPPGSAQTEAAISVLHQWALRDFAGAKAWVELFPDGEIRQRAMNELAGVREYSLADAGRAYSGESSR